jgi:hypothetical protein
MNHFDVFGPIYRIDPKHNYENLELHFKWLIFQLNIIIEFIEIMIWNIPVPI